MTEYQKERVECIVPTEIVVEVKLGLFDAGNHQVGVVAGPKQLVLYPHAEELHRIICEAVGKVAADVGITSHGDVHLHDASWRRRGAALRQEKGQADCPAEDDEAPRHPILPDLDDLDD